MASLEELRADLLRRLAKFLPMEESSAAATSSLSTTSSTERTAAAPLAPIATTTPKLVSHPVLEQQMTKPSSSLVFSAGQVVGDGGPRVDAVFASALPTRCSTICSTINVGSNHAAVAFPTSGTELKVDDQLTHIGGLSLFLELDLDSANKVFEDDVFTTVGGISLFLDLNMEFEVLTCVGDCSIFLQPSMGDPTEVFDTPPTVDMDKVLDHGVGVPVKGCKLKRVQTHAETCVSQPTFCVISRSRKDAKAMQLATYRFLIKVPSWRRSGFSPGYYERPRLEIMPSGRRGGFSPGGLVLAFVTETRMLHYFLIKVWDFSVTVYSALLSVTFSMEVNLYSLHIILAKFHKCPVEQLAFCKCVLNVAKAAMLTLLTLTLKDASCLIRKLLRLSVSFMDMIQKLYVGNSIQSYEVSACMGVIQSRGDSQPSFCVNSQCAVQLPVYLMLQCLISDLWECTSNHMVEVKKYVDYLCRMELLLTYQSACTFQDHLSLVDKPIAATLFALEVKAAMQRHHGVTVRAVTRRDAFKRIASEGAEYNIKLGTRSHNFGVQIFCSVATSGNKLQYMIWDPGVHLSVCAISLEVTAAGGRGASFSRRLHCGNILLRLRYGRVVAWGQATFCRGGTVTPCILWIGLVLSVAVYGLGPASERSGWKHKRGHRGQMRGWKKKQNRSLDSLLCPVRLVLSPVSFRSGDHHRPPVP